MPRIDRTTLMKRFRAMKAAGEPIVGGGAGTGLSALSWNGRGPMVNGQQSPSLSIVSAYVIFTLLRYR